MNGLKKFTSACRAIFRREKLDADMAEEMRLHLERRTQAFISEGLSPEEARYAAQRSFGGVDQLKELAREQRAWIWVEHLARDVRFATRQLAKTPGFTVIAVLSLALGMGAATSVFTLVESILLRSLPVPNPHELRVLHWSGVDTRIRSISSDLQTVGNRSTADAVSLPMFFNLREKSAELADVFGFSPVNDVTVQKEGGAFSAKGWLVSDNFFSALGARAFIGSLFAPEQERTDGSAAQQIVITHEWWQSRFLADPRTLGRAVMLNGKSFTIAGVLPRKFPGINPGDPRDFYALLTPSSTLIERTGLSNPADHWWIRLMARIKPGRSDAQVKAVLDGVFPSEAAAMMKSPEILLRAGDRGLAAERDRHGRTLLSILAVVSLLMLVACTNLAGLSLARGAARRHELSIRGALGASRGRFLQQSLTESLLLALMGGALGVLLAIWGKGVLSRLLAGTEEGLSHDLSLNLTVLGFGLVAAVVAGVLSGLLPAWQASRVNPLDGLKSRGASTTSKPSAGKVLVTAQIALTVVLAAGGGLYLRTLRNFQAIDTGFNQEGLLVFRLNPNVAEKSQAQIAGFYARVQESLLTLPGVLTASPAMLPLLSGESWSGDFTIPGRVTGASSDLQTHRLIVGERYFSALEIPFVQGRALGEADGETSSRVIVVNETFARRYFPGENILGRTVKILRYEWTVIGVSRDTKYTSVREAAPPTVYFSFRQYPLRYGANFVVRTSLPPLALAGAVREAVASIDPGVPVLKLTTQENLAARGLAGERLVAALGCALAALAVLLACIGLYGLMSFHVTRRRREIAIRMAIGARPNAIAMKFLSEAMALIGAGLGLGLPLAVGLAHIVKSQLHGVQPHDPATLLVVAGILVVVGLLAAWLPARRATRVDPLVALRAE